MNGRAERNAPYAGKAGNRGPTGRSRFRLLGLLILFDALLIAAVLLSFQGTELIEEEVTLKRTREVYDIQIREQIITNTITLTEVVPYGAEP